MIPQHKGKHSGQAVFEPKAYTDYLKRTGRYPKVKAPEKLIICFYNQLYKSIKQNFKVTAMDSDYHKVLLFDEMDRQVGVLGNFGIGAPVATIYLEELIALGVKQVVTVGIAGSLQKQINVGDLVLCNSALRDEGVSYHYLESSKYASPSAILTGKLRNCLTRKNIAFHEGSTWTIDTPFRETIDEVKAYQAEGILTVEMEAAALFSVAKFRQIESAALFCVSDSLADFRWNPQFDAKKVKDSLQIILQVAIEGLL